METGLLEDESYGVQSEKEDYYVSYDQDSFLDITKINFDIEGPKEFEGKYIYKPEKSKKSGRREFLKAKKLLVWKHEKQNMYLYFDEDNKVFFFDDVPTFTTYKQPFEQSIGGGIRFVCRGFFRTEGSGKMLGDLGEIFQRLNYLAGENYKYKLLYGGGSNTPIPEGLFYINYIPEGLSLQRVSSISHKLKDEDNGTKTFHIIYGTPTPVVDISQGGGKSKKTKKRKSRKNRKSKKKKKLRTKKRKSNKKKRTQRYH